MIYYNESLHLFYDTRAGRYFSRREPDLSKWEKISEEAEIQLRRETIWNNN